MVRTPGAINRPKSDDELIQILKERGYHVSKNEPQPPAPPADPPYDPPETTPAEKLEIKRPGPAKVLNTCGLCGGRFEGKPARCPQCNVEFSGWRED